MFVELSGDNEADIRVVKQLILSGRTIVDGYYKNIVEGMVSIERLELTKKKKVILLDVVLYEENKQRSVWYERSKTESELMEEAVGDLFD